MSYMMDTLFNIAEGRAITVEEAQGACSGALVEDTRWLINGLDTALRTRLTKFDYDNKTNNGPL